MPGSDEFHTLPFAYDRADFVALAEIGRRPIVDWLFRLAWVLLALAIVLIAINVAAGSTRGLAYLPVFLLLVGAFLLLKRFGPKLGGWTLHRMARRNDLLREQRMTVAPDCFRSESSRGKTEVRWSAVPRIREHGARLFIYSTRHAAFIIPDRAFDSREDFLAFGAAAKKRWGQHHRM